MMRVRRDRSGRRAVGTLDAGLNAVADEKTDCSVAAGTSEIELLEKDVKEARCELDAALQYAADALHKLQGAGVPIGWDDARMKAAGFKRWDLTLFQVPVPVSQKGAATAFWLLLGGFLVGLGGPFWYDMVKSLSAIRTVAGSVGAKTDDKAAATGSTMTDGVVQTGTTTLPKTAIEHFNVSAAGRDAADGIGVGEQDDEPPVG